MKKLKKIKKALIFIALMIFWCTKIVYAENTLLRVPSFIQSEDSSGKFTEAANEMDGTAEQKKDWSAIEK